MSSSKKKNRDDQIPKPISIKKEKSEEDRTLHPISHYIDDRLELVKQIFGTLKPKTIMNLAPEFLKKTTLDEIEELCLNELLCISTKRLKSILAGTRCPTDTESSEDSDVEHKEEHISLEEISSDSDIGNNEKRRAKKLRKKASKTDENKESTGQISVLELLELQARARAIRSQLAMEPITKIEVKSDDDEQEVTEKPKDIGKESHAQKSSKGSKRKSNSLTETKAAKKDSQSNESSSRVASVPTKKIKLKRNYRNSATTPEIPVDRKVEPTTKGNTQATPDTNKSRSASPDVIAIPAATETLLITDSTDDESQADLEKKKLSNRTELGPTKAPEAPEPAELSEPEEGEVREDSDTEAMKEAVPETPIGTTGESRATTAEEGPAAEAAPTEETSNKASEELSKADVHHELPTSVASVDDDDDDQNDDVISIGGDLEHEMIEELAKEVEPETKVKNELTEPEEEDNDVISLETSEDEPEKLEEPSTESWRTRYLKSSKVNQVLAASRLGTRVRDKIKESKRAQKKHSEVKEVSGEKSQQQQFTSKHEDGSVEQYQELLQHRQRKTSNSSKGDK